MKRLFFIIMLVLSSAVSAHAYLTAAEPANGSTVSIAPSEVVLTFNEAMEVRFSLFKIYPLETASGASIRELQQAVSSLIEDVIQLRGDEEARADVELLTEERTTETITLRLKENLPAGTYVVMWRVLSIDTHTTEDFMLFTLEPPQTADMGDVDDEDSY